MTETESQKQINVYDFDKTIYDGDSTVDFWKFCLKHHKKILFSTPSLILPFIKYCFGIIDKTKFKECFFRFLKKLPDADAEVKAFWDTHFVHIKDWYLSSKEPSDVIISASPEFLLRPAAEKLGVSLIASSVNPLNGKFTGENCKGEEKVKRFRAEYPDAEIKKFYSDSLSDTPLAEISNEAYIVSGDKIIPWNEYHPSGLTKMKKTFLSKDFLLFIFCGGVGTLTNFICSLLISLLIDPTVSYVFGYFISLFVTYALSAKLIFSAKLKPLVFGKFVISYLPNFLIQIIFVALFINILGWHKAIAYALAIIIGLPISFLLVKVFAFKRRQSTNLVK